MKFLVNLVTAFVFGIGFAFGQTNCDMAANFLDDFAADADKLTTIAGRPELVDSWKVLHNAGRNTLKTDPLILSKVSDLLNKSGMEDFVKTIQNPMSSTPKFGSAEEFLETFAKRHTEAPGGQLSFDVELDNLTHFYNNYKSLSNAGEYMEEMLQSGSKFKGGSYGLDLLKNNMDELTENGKYILDGFEGGIDDAVSGHRFDFRFKSVENSSVIKMVETKHWSSPQAISGTTYDQFKAYFQSQKLFEYRFKDIAPQMKVEFQNLLKKSDKVDELWDLNSSFFESKGFEFKQDVIDAANAGLLENHSLLDFIK